MGIAQINENNREFLLNMMKNLQLDKKLKEEGREEGIEEGEIKKAIEMAKAMILDGEGNEKIKKYTKLEYKIIDKLRN